MMDIKINREAVDALAASAARKHDNVPERDKRGDRSSTYYSQRAFFMGMYIAFGIIASLMHGDRHGAAKSIESYLDEEMRQNISTWEVQSDK